MSISTKQGLFSVESLHPDSENIEGFYKAHHFTYCNAIAFGVSEFVFCDLNTYFQL